MSIALAGRKFIISVCVRFELIKEKDESGRIAFPWLCQKHLNRVQSVSAGDQQPEDLALSFSPAKSPSPSQGLAGKVTMNVDPLPGMLLAVILPPCRSTILRHMARPIPVPSYSLLPCRRWKGTNMRSRYCSSKPMPLSSTKICHSDHCRENKFLFEVFLRHGISKHWR